MSDSDGKKTLGLRGGSRSGNVKQSFSHGRTKNVVVETKRKRVVVPKPGTSKSSGGQKSGAGDPSKRPAGISDAEMERRLKALQAAKAREVEEKAQREAEEKARQEERDRRRAEQEAKEREEREREEALKAKEEEEERAKKEAEEAARRAAAEAQTERDAFLGLWLPTQRSMVKERMTEGNIDIVTKNLEGAPEYLREEAREDDAAAEAGGGRRDRPRGEALGDTAAEGEAAVAGAGAAGPRKRLVGHQRRQFLVIARATARMTMQMHRRVPAPGGREQVAVEIAHLAVHAVATAVEAHDLDAAQVLTTARINDGLAGEHLDPLLAYAIDQQPLRLGTHVDDRGHLVYRRVLVHVGEHRDAESIANLLEHGETLLHAGPAKARRGGTVGLVERRLVNEVHADACGDLDQRLGRLERQRLAFHHAGTGNQEQGPVVADFDAAEIHQRWPAYCTAASM